jgi:hypothetical protein
MRGRLSRPSRGISVVVRDETGERVFVTGEPGSDS